MRVSCLAIAVIGALATSVPAPSPADEPAARASAPARRAVPPARPWFVDATREAGLDFTHHAARSASWFLPETMGSGGALLDLDGDGDLDVLLLDSGPPPGTPAREGMPNHALFENISEPGRPRFRPLPAPALPGLCAMGACTGDVDGDGDVDVYVTGLPEGRLLLSTDGRLVPAPGNGGIADAGWGTSCVFLDRGSGRLDLFVAHYVIWSAATERSCGGEREGFRSYCPPDQYPPEQNRLFAGDGKGRFTDATEAAGLMGDRGKGLGVVVADFDDDGRADISVANDQTPSALLLGQAGGRFRDVGLLSGTALSEEGRAQAGMGVDAGDADGDGDLDITKTNFALEPNNLYAATGVRGGVPRFRDLTRPSGLSAASLPMLGFGTILTDLDGDGDPDIFVTNGHIMPNASVLNPSVQHAQVDQLFENAGLSGGVPVFRDARERWEPASSAAGVGRGLLAGDLDGDGDVDLLITRNDGPARLLRNESNPAAWVGIQLRTTTSAPGAPGARVTLRGAGQPRVQVRRTGGSYLTASDERILFGLAGVTAATPLRAEVRWPGGKLESFPLTARQTYVTLVEGKGTGVAAPPPNDGSKPPAPVPPPAPAGGGGGTR